jgi:hypothetical protein
VLGDPITFRCKEVDERKKSTARLRETIDTYMSQATSTDEKYAHIDEKDKQSVVEKVATIQKWLEDQTVRQSEGSKDVDSVLTSAEIEKKRDELIYYAIPILTKPKSKPPVIPSHLLLERIRRRVILRRMKHLLGLERLHHRRKVIVDCLRWMLIGSFIFLLVLVSPLDAMSFSSYFFQCVFVLK